MAGGKAYLLHRIWQRTGRYPTELLGIAPEQVSREGLLAFFYASELIAMEDEDKAKPYPVFLAKSKEDSAAI